MLAIFDHFIILPQGMIDVHRKNRLCSTAWTPAASSISPVRQAVQRQLQGSIVQLSWSISLPVFCSTDLSGKSSWYHDMSTRHAEQTLSHGHPWQDRPKHTGLSQRNTGLADLSGLCPCLDSSCHRTLQQRCLLRQSAGNCVRTGFNHDRSLSCAVSMGKVQNTQGCG